MMQHLLNEKADHLFRLVTTDDRWDVADETLLTVFGMMYYGYCFGLGRLICSLDAATINALVVEKLTSLGAGPQYAQGLVDHAFGTFRQPSGSLYARLISSGHAHFGADDLTALVDAVFQNAKSVRESNGG